ncbi:MAG: methionyl-tRNA formyltransferase [Candidatus Promineifilaceae bacterium]|nr:methionyl-tRNA formyltransferase [Candidatus Promineifilaceae bacterium]
MSRIVFMGTPDFALPVLQALLETQELVGVVTQPDRPAGRGRQPRPSPVKEAALAAGVPLYQPRSLKSPEGGAPIRAWKPEAIVVAAYGQILRPHLLDLPPLGSINVHASLLPRWRGASPIQHAILAGDEESGISLMQMDVGLDTGPVYVRRALSLRPDETAATLHDRLAELGGQMIRDHLPAILSGALTPVPQDDTQATYAPMISKEDGRLNWSDGAVQLERQIRAMTPWPSAFTAWNGQRLKIWEARPHAERHLPSGEPGQVTGDADAVVVCTGEGALELLQVQPAGKQTMAAADFIRGRPDFIGSVLGEQQ